MHSRLVLLLRGERHCSAVNATIDMVAGEERWGSPAVFAITAASQMK